MSIAVQYILRLNTFVSLHSTRPRYCDSTWHPSDRVGKKRSSISRRRGGKCWRSKAEVPPSRPWPSNHKVKWFVYFFTGEKVPKRFYWWQKKQKTNEIQNVSYSILIPNSFHNLNDVDFWPGTFGQSQMQPANKPGNSSVVDRRTKLLLQWGYESFFVFLFFLRIRELRSCSCDAITATPQPNGFANLLLTAHTCQVTGNPCSLWASEFVQQRQLPIRAKQGAGVGYLALLLTKLVDFFFFLQLLNRPLTDVHAFVFFHREDVESNSNISCCI